MREKEISKRKNRKRKNKKMEREGHFQTNNAFAYSIIYHYSLSLLDAYSLQISFLHSYIHTCRVLFTKTIPFFHWIDRSIISSICSLHVLNDWSSSWWSFFNRSDQAPRWSRYWMGIRRASILFDCSVFTGHASLRNFLLFASRRSFFEQSLINSISILILQRIEKGKDANYNHSVIETFFASCIDVCLDSPACVTITDARERVSLVKAGRCVFEIRDGCLSGDEITST